MTSMTDDEHTENTLSPDAHAFTKMIGSDLACSHPLHRLSPAARSFFGHQPPGEWAYGWPAPFRKAVRLIQDRINPPLYLDQLHQLAAMLRSEFECAVVRRWFESATYLRRSELAVVTAYALNRDADLPAPGSMSAPEGQQ